MSEIFGILSNELTGYETELRRLWSTDLVRVNTELGRLNLPPLDPQCTNVKGCAAKPKLPHDLSSRQGFALRDDTSGSTGRDGRPATTPGHVRSYFG
jgi:hypothetical protein